MTAADRLVRLNAKALRRFGASHVLDGVAVQGAFVRPGKAFALGEGPGVQSDVPLLLVASGDVPVDPVGLEATCEDELYTVQEVRPDGLGLTVLELERIPA